MKNKPKIKEKFEDILDWLFWAFIDWIGPILISIITSIVTVILYNFFNR